MRRGLGTTLLPLFVLLAPLAGCGDEGPDSAPDAASATVVACDDGDDTDCLAPPVLVSGTAGGGTVSTDATELADQAAVTAYVRQFGDPFAAEVTRAIDGIEVGDGDTLVAAVVSVGCDVPPGVTVRRLGGDVVITPERVAAPLEECFAPVTTVALASVPGG